MRSIIALSFLMFCFFNSYAQVDTINQFNSNPPPFIPKNISTEERIKKLNHIKNTLPSRMSSEIYFVDIDAGPGGDGLSWNTAFNDLQSAIDESLEGDQIWVANGLYLPTSKWGGNSASFKTFYINKNISIYGGFQGWEWDLDMRSWISNPTILSGDIDMNDINNDGNAIAETPSDIIGNNSYHVVFTDKVSENCILDGFIITAGQANGSLPENRGGGLFNNGRHPQNAPIVGNSSNPSIFNCFFIGNYSTFIGGAIHNSGWRQGEANPYFENCTFQNNQALVSGGAIYTNGNDWGQANPSFFNCKFRANLSGSRGGALFDCGFRGESESLLINCLLSGNKSAQGASIYNEGGGGGNVGATLINVTVSGNHATNHGAVIFEKGGSNEAISTVRNSILWNNQSGNQIGDGIYYQSASTKVSFKNSIVQGAFTNGTWNNSVGNDLGENFDSPPLFLAPIAPTMAPTIQGSYHIDDCSPAINQGDQQEFIALGNVIDLDGNSRINGPEIDLGPYESQFSGSSLSCLNPIIYLDADGTASLAPEDLFDSQNSIYPCGPITLIELSQNALDCNDIGVQPVELSASDHLGNMLSCTGNVTVIYNTPPSALCNNTTLYLNNSGYATLTIEDINNGSNDECGDVQMALDMSDFNCSHVGDNTVTLIVTGTGGNASCTSTVTVEDGIAPISSCQDLTIYLDQNGEYTMLSNELDLNSYDVCGIASFSLSQNYFDCTDLGNLLVSQTVTDVNGNTNECTATVTIIDNASPTPLCNNAIVDFNGESSIALASNLLWNENASFDNCGTLIVTDIQPTNINCSDLGSVIPVEVTVQDQSNNIGTCTSYIDATGLPCGWSEPDGGIGCPDSEIDYTANGIFELTGNCMNGSSSQDNQVFVGQSICGDATVIVKIESIINGYVGVSCRENNAPLAKQFSLFGNLTNSLLLEYRLITGSPKQIESPYSIAPIWLKIDRIGDWFFAYSSPTGSNWQYVGAKNIIMNNCISMGATAFSLSPNFPVEAMVSQLEIINIGPSQAPLGNNISVKQNDEQHEINVFPNPVKDVVNINTSFGQSGFTSISILSPSGKIVKRFSSTNNPQYSTQVDMKSLESGLYFIQIHRCNDTLPLTYKIVKD